MPVHAVLMEPGAAPCKTSTKSVTLCMRFWVGSVHLYALHSTLIDELLLNRLGHHGSVHVGNAQHKVNP